MSKHHRALENDKQDELISFSTTANRFFRKIINAIISKNKIYHQRRVDNDERWKFIQPHMDGNKSCLDIGCASGYLTRKCADEGLLTLGIDDLSQSSSRLQNALSKHGYNQNVGFGNWRITPENVSELPKFDCILAMTVYHHFVKHFGEKEANIMMEKICNKSNILVIEFPGWRWTGRSLTLEVTSQRSDEVIKLTNHKELSSYGVQIRPNLNKYIDAGEYKIIVHADGYKSSDTLNVSINNKKSFDSRLRIMFDDNQLRLVSGEDAGLGIRDVIKWYDELVEEIFPNSIQIMDKTTVDYFGDGRKNIIYILECEGD